MMAWRLNEKNGIYKKGSPFPILKRHQILQSWLQTGNKSATAKQNLCSIGVVTKITEKFMVTGNCTPGERGRPQPLMDVWMKIYLEILVTVYPFMHLTEMQRLMRTELNLQPHEVPSITLICRTLNDLDLKRHKATKVALERFTPLNMDRRRAFFQWRSMVDPRRVYFVDETGFEIDLDLRTIGRYHTNDSLPSYERKSDARIKMSVLAIIGFDQGVIGVYPIHGSYNRLSFNNVMSRFFLPLVPPGSYIVMDNASIHNDADMANMLRPLNMTLVKLPTYSYDLNPIEMVNGIAKACAKRNPGQLRNNMPFAIVNAFTQVTPQAVQHFYRKSWQIFV